MVELLDTETQRTGVSYSKRQQKRKRKEQAFPTRRKKDLSVRSSVFCLPLAKKVSRIIFLFQTTFVIIVRSSVFLPASCKKSITNNLFVPDDICYYCPFECFFACLLQKKVSRMIYLFQTTFVIIVRSSVFLPASCKKKYHE
jgi:general stress protein CsbA